MPTILNYLNDRERGRHYHFVGLEGTPLSFCRILASPMPPPHDSKMLYYLNDRDEGRHYFCRILAPPNAPTPPLTPQYLTILMTVRGAPLSVVEFWHPPPPMIPPDATILNYPNDRERGAPLSFIGLWRPPMPLLQTPQYFLKNLNDRERGRHYHFLGF